MFRVIPGTRRTCAGITLIYNIDAYDKYTIIDNSFNKNSNLLKEYLSCIKHKFNIILLAETWLTSHDNPSIYCPTYNVLQLSHLCKKKK